MSEELQILDAADLAEFWEPEAAGRPHPGQHRLTGLQLVNWGTFSGHHSVPISDRGFLLTGASGSGKSSLLDAISVVLVPAKWLDLNAAARDTNAKGRDRNLTSYIRGAWSRNTDETSGEVATQYLRPGATWSAIGLRFSDGLGVETTLVRVFWAARGVNSDDSITKTSIIFDSDFDLRALEDVVANGLNLRSVKARLDPFFAASDYASFADKFTRRLGISGDRALRLLHKTQSTKGLANLDTLLRDFMLDEPATFAAAQRTVEQFVELEDAYRSVQRAERQVERLAPIRELDRIRGESRSTAALFVADLASTDGFRVVKSIEAHEREIERLERAIETALASEVRASVTADDLDGQLRALREQHGQAGGSQLQAWRTEIASLTEQLAAPQRTLALLRQKLRALGSSEPSSAAEFADLVAQAQREAESIVGAAESLNEARTEASVMTRVKVDELNIVRGQLAALARQPSNIDSKDLELRDRLATALKVTPKRLPFVAELLEVPAEHAAWRGAIERLLGGFSRSVIVPEALYSAASEYIDTHHLGRKLLYNRVGPASTEAVLSVGSDSVVRRIGVAPGEFAPWLNSELSRRYDYVCADSISAFRSHDRAITVTGQIKHTRTRHEKDDRHQVDDRRSWVLGFDNHDKNELYRQDETRLLAELDAAKASLDTVVSAQAGNSARLEACQYIANLHWDDVNAEGRIARIHDLETQVAKYSAASGELAGLDRRLESLARQARDARLSANSAAGQVSAEREEAARRRVGLAEAAAEQSALEPLEASAGFRLDARFTALARSVTLDKLGETVARMTTAISRELDAARRTIGETESELVRIFTAFSGEWPADVADADTSVASTADYLRILETIEFDGLPKFQGRFRELLQTQSNQNLAHLVQLMAQEQKEVRKRIQPVNDSLASVDFNAGTYLELKVKERFLPEVKEFRLDVQRILENSLTASDSEAEAKYEALHALVTRLGSSSFADRSWREIVLDVRKHVEFQGLEKAADGTVVDIHTSGDGRSGGQRVKLVTFALAAALRYQLGGHKAVTPRYGTVIIDEAFDKADAEFTEGSMRIFERFGFQMILATPLKMVQTLSEFIGGAALVSIRNRNESSLSHLEITDLAGPTA
ncbi:MAG: ATP-binding protein [Actinomycetota bacterium]